MSLFHRHTDYSIEQGNIRYMDGSSLLRPMDMPRSQQIVMAVFVVIAVIIGVRLAAGAITAVNDSNAQSQASVEENLSRTVSYNLPVLTQMADMDDQAILDSLAAAGYTVYNQTAEGTAGLDLVKLPDDVTVADAAAMYAKGVGSLSASQAALLLNGSWTLTVDRSRYLDHGGEVRRLLVEHARGRNPSCHRRRRIRVLWHVHGHRRGGQHLPNRHRRYR